MGDWVEDVFRPALARKARDGTASSVMALAEQLLDGASEDDLAGDARSRGMAALMTVVMGLPGLQVETHSLATPMPPSSAEDELL